MTSEQWRKRVIGSSIDYRDKIYERQLADYPVPTITLPVERVKEFQKQFNLLLEFSATVCGCEPKELTLMHMIAFFERADK